MKSELLDLIEELQDPKDEAERIDILNMVFFNTVEHVLSDEQIEEVYRCYQTEKMARESPKVIECYHCGRESGVNYCPGCMDEINKQIF